ncbi:hypothetical protein WMY93_006626 [Mugilogobius chulae]|uniref:Centriolar coiled-coil protein of 110 kDa n=1 Tax=Mugilogobius chulae TaxID=88201 RepID=A0AAW0PN46_9GOBI
MENYEKFVEFHRSELKRFKDVDENKHRSSSLICFYGRPILPPLLSGTQREEMVNLKEAAIQKAEENRKKCKDDPRMSYVQTILHSVHIRKTPTLEDILKESDFGSQASSTDCVGGSLSESTSTKKYLSATEKFKNSLGPLPLTNCSAILTSPLPPHTGYSKMSHDVSQASDAGLVSSGYISYTNVENTVSAIDSQKDLFLSEEEYVEDFLVHNSSDTVKKMPDIISYPPVDGEELERSGQDFSFGLELETENPESISFNPGLAEEFFDVHPEKSQLKEMSCDNNQETDVKNDLTNASPAPECFIEIPTCPNEEIQTDEDDSKPSQEPYRMSLQALLKKSQEYRRRQRMLRSQAKSAKIQDRAQDQPKSEEQSLSDKENDERLTKETEPRNNPERNDTHSYIVDQPLKSSYENDRKGDHFSDNNNESYSTIKINNWLNSSNPGNVPLSVPIWAENINYSNECSANTSPSGFNEVKKYHNIPALNFCRSPVPCKVKSPSAPLDENSKKEVVINTSVSKKTEGSYSSVSPLNVVESDVTSVLAKSSQHIDQLEFNLSGLKVLISDLESTLTENLDKSSSQSENQQTQRSQNNSVCCLENVCYSQKNLMPDSFNSSNDIVAVHSPQLLTTIVTSSEKDHTRLINAHNTRRPPSSKSTLSMAQRMRIPDMFRTCLPESTNQSNISVLSDSSNHPIQIDSDVGRDSRSTSLNQSYDVDTPSELWLHSVGGSQKYENKQLTPESGGEGQGMGSKVKRRLQMTDVIMEKGDEQAPSRPSSSTPKAATRWHEGLDSVKERQEQLRQIHAAQIRALQEEHLRQQEQLLQTLATRYSLLQGMSLPYSMSTSRLGDTVTFLTLSQPASSPFPEHHRHLLSAVAKGFLTRRLLRTERVAQLVRTARDTQQFLQAFQKHSPNKGLPSRQDLLLQERVTLQLRAARYEIYDIFFSLSTKERMQLISTDRELVREKELKRQSGLAGPKREKSSLSAATQKSLERKRSLM